MFDATALRPLSMLLVVDTPFPRRVDRVVQRRVDSVLESTSGYSEGVILTRATDGPSPPTCRAERRHYDEARTRATARTTRSDGTATLLRGRERPCRTLRRVPRIRGSPSGCQAPLRDLSTDDSRTALERDPELLRRVPASAERRPGRVGGSSSWIGGVCRRSPTGSSWPVEWSAPASAPGSL